MGSCFSIDRQHGSGEEAVTQQTCELQRVPCQVLVSILSLLDQQELFGTCPLVCKSWQSAAHLAAQALHLNLSSPARQLQLPRLLLYLKLHGQQLQQLQLSSSTPLGFTSRRALLRCLVSGESWDGRRLQLQQLALQLDLDNYDLAFITRHICKLAPGLHTLKLQPVKPSLADLQLLVLACILGNILGNDAPGPVLPHLSHCSGAVQQLACGATQLRSLSLSRYDIRSTGCISPATQLTALSLQHCSLSDASLAGLTSLRLLHRLELSDNFLTAECLCHLTHLSQTLTHLDLSVMPSISRMRNSSLADLWAIGKLQGLLELNVIGFGVADATPLQALSQLTRLEAGLNPLSGKSLRTIGQLSRLQQLELGGISQSWVLSSLLPPPEALRVHDVSWYGFCGMQSITRLDLGGCNFSNLVWVCHICPVLGRMRCLKQLQLAHCHIPAGKLLELMPELGSLGQLQDLTLDRCSCNNDELAALVLYLTRLTRLSAVALLPKLGNKQAAQLAQLTSLRCLSVRSNDLGSRGVQALAKGLSQLSALDVGENPKVGRRCLKQLSHLLKSSESCTAQAEADGRYW